MQYTFDYNLHGHKYIEYRPGTLNIILTVPHGGYLRPKFIPNRDHGSYIGGKIRYNHIHAKSTDLPVKVKADLHTVDLAGLLANALNSWTGRRPHVIINHLHRSKLDCNCDIEEATFGVAEAVETWYEFHNCIEAAKATMSHEGGLLFDIHGHQHPENWVELGYGISSGRLDSGQFTFADTTIRHLHERIVTCNASNPPDIRGLISGPQSLGGILSSRNEYSVVPSPHHVGPHAGKYFSGGYNVLRHGSKHGGVVDAIQIESPTSLREPAYIAVYADALAEAISAFLKLYYK